MELQPGAHVATRQWGPQSQSISGQSVMAGGHMPFVASNDFVRIAVVLCSNQQSLMHKLPGREAGKKLTIANFKLYTGIQHGSTWKHSKALYCLHKSADKKERRQPCCIEACATDMRSGDPHLYIIHTDNFCICLQRAWASIWMLTSSLR